MNGVKQGDVYMVCGVFCVYIDDLLKSLAEANVGCYIGSCFVGVFAYADDLAPTAMLMLMLAPTAMRRMLHICDVEATEKVQKSLKRATKLVISLKNYHI